MKKIERIMVVIDANEDFSSAPDGLPVELRKALRFVQDKQAAEIKLVSVGYEKYLGSSFHMIAVDYAALQKEYCDRLSASMQNLVDQLAGQGYNISSAVRWAHPRYEAIVKEAEDFKADLLIQHCRAYGKIEHHHLTNDSWQLVRHCPLPLLLVKDKEWGDPVVMMAAVDPLHSHSKPMQLDRQIIDASSSISGQLAGTFHIVHAYAESARPFAPAGTIKAEHSAAFSELVGGYNFDEANLHLIDETPVYALQHYSEKLNSDIVVMGAVSRSRFSEALIGSTAEEVLDYVKTDLLIVKPSAE
ncbi:MAG: universal stress protein [Pseudohongiella sp.]|nr:universal stress protein [Pseudohongiella sp.]